MLLESSLPQLYDSAVKAFPYTTKRQYATDPVKLVRFHWTPFLGLNTLFIRGLAQNENREYDCIILFKKVNYKIQEGARNAIKVIDSTGTPFIMQKLSENQDVLVRCSCPDFRWRFNYYDHLDHSLYGRKAAAYRSKGQRGPANPMELPGICKHVMKMTTALADAGLFM
jgi:hypothetical protein